MISPITDAMTSVQARTTLAMLEIAIRKHDRRGDTQELLRDIHTLAWYMETTAHGVPDDTDWPEYGEVETVNGSAD